VIEGPDEDQRMRALSAEQSFRKGLAALADSRPEHAADHFLAAMEAEQSHGARQPDTRYLSYYGLSLARAFEAGPDAVRVCEAALADDPTSSNALLNLGRVYLLMGRIEDALACLDRGARFAPTHGALARELGRVDRRARSLCPWLDRSHPLNRLGGRLRAVLGVRRRSDV
jgi:tetratricopeptide (TPR) repeat protein